MLNFKVKTWNVTMSLTEYLNVILDVSHKELRREREGVRTWQDRIGCSLTENSALGLQRMWSVENLSWLFRIPLWGHTVKTEARSGRVGAVCWIKNLMEGKKTNMYSLEHSENFLRQSQAKMLPAAKKRASDTHLKATSCFPWFFILRVSLFSSKTLRVPKFRQPSVTKTREKLLLRQHRRTLLRHLAGFSCGWNKLFHTASIAQLFESVHYCFCAG